MKILLTRLKQSWIFPFLLIFASFLAQESMAQGEPDLIQLSGIVVDGENAYGVPGVHIYIPRAGIGTVSNPVGFFSLPTVVGDTVLISAVGFKKQRLIIPSRDDRGFTVLIDLKTDTTYLPIIEVFPYPTEELFKEAFLALELPDENRKNMAKNLEPEQLQKVAARMSMDGGSNHRYYMEQRSNQIGNRFFNQSFSLLNPFAWAEFIKSVKRGDLKKKE